MPKMVWEWKLTPQIIVSLANLAIMTVGVIGIFMKMQYDISTGQQAVSELKAMVGTMREGQAIVADRVTKVETKMDMILPTLQRIENNQRSR